MSSWKIGALLTAACALIIVSGCKGSDTPADTTTGGTTATTAGGGTTGAKMGTAGDTAGGTATAGAATAGAATAGAATAGGTAGGKMGSTAATTGK